MNPDLLIKSIQDCKILIIDEISAATISLLLSIHKRCQEILKNTNYFGNINAILFIGDFKQLPPGKGASILNSFVFSQNDLLILFNFL